MFHTPLLLLIFFSHNVASSTSLPEGLRFKNLPASSPNSVPLLSEGHRVRARLLKRFFVEATGHDRPMLELVRDLQSRYGQVTCDCGLFVQIVAQLPKREAAVFLPTAENYPEVVACACGMDLVYLRVQDDTAHRSLQSTTLNNKGLWLLPQEEDLYLGLSDEGPLLLTLGAWQRRMTDDLSCEARLSQHPLETRFVSILEQTGLLQFWKLERFSKTWPPRYKRDLERILNRARDVYK